MLNRIVHRFMRGCRQSHFICEVLFLTVRHTLRFIGEVKILLKRRQRSFLVESRKLCLHRDENGIYRSDRNLDDCWLNRRLQRRFWLRLWLWRLDWWLRRRGGGPLLPRRWSGTGGDAFDSERRATIPLYNLGASRADGADDFCFDPRRKTQGKIALDVMIGCGRGGYLCAHIGSLISISSLELIDQALSGGWGKGVQIGAGDNVGSR